MLVAMSSAEFWDEKFTADSQAASTGSTSVFGGHPNPTIKQQVEVIRKGFSGTPRALDLGCGRGRHTVWLAQHGWDTTGMDFSHVGLEHTAEALAAEGLSAKLVQQDLAQWQPEPGSFELIVAAFIHLPRKDQEHLWRAVAEALTPGGYFVSISHHPDNQGHGPRDPEVLYTAGDVTEFFANEPQSLEAVVSQRAVVKHADGGDVVDTIVVLRKTCGEN